VDHYERRQFEKQANMTAPAKQMKQLMMIEIDELLYYPELESPRGTQVYPSTDC
jgi:hypothetical protein